MSNSGRTSDQKNEVITGLPAWQDDLINQICNALDNYYCLPDKFTEKKEAFRQSLVDTFKKINAQQSSKTSNEPTSKDAYQIYIDEINKALDRFDPHLEIEYNKDFIAERVEEKQIVKDTEKHTAKFDFGSGPPQEVLLEMNEYRGKPNVNYGFIDRPDEAIDIPKDIGYIKINCLLPPDLGADEKENKFQVGPNAVKALNKIMRESENKKAMIIDLRDAPEGGSPEMVQYIVSFFIQQKGMIINEIDDRLTGTRKAYPTVNTPYQLFDVPVDILVDETTFSGREELAYDLQQLNIQLKSNGEQKGDRFQIIGEVTRGGAHPEFSFPLMSASGDINEHLILRIPYACSINPTSGTNWEDQEKKGVQPDQQVDKEDALVVAVDHLKRVISQDQKKLDESSVSSQSMFAKSKQYLAQEAKKRKELSVTDEEMAKSAFGQGSNTAKKTR